MLRLMFGLCACALVSALGMHYAPQNLPPQWKKTVAVPDAPRSAPERDLTVGSTKRVAPPQDDSETGSVATGVLDFLVTQTARVLNPPSEPDGQDLDSPRVNRPHRADWPADRYDEFTAQIERDSVRFFEEEGFSPEAARFMADLSTRMSVALSERDTNRNQGDLSGCEIRDGIKRCPVPGGN